jgi:hypothetical protein
MSRIFAWTCLALVASASAYGLQLTAAALAPSAASAQQVTSATLTRTELIVAVDPVTGDNKWQLECNVPVDSFASDVVLVDASGFPAVLQVCIDSAGS